MNGSGGPSPETLRRRIGTDALDAWTRDPVAGLRAKLQLDDTRLGFVGGCVRDWALRTQGKDVDLVWKGPFAELAAAVEASGIEARIRPIYLTLTCRLQGHAIDIAATRRDAYAEPGGIPQVSPGTLDEDLRRRDFTANAMTVFVVDGQTRLYDPCRGLDDIAAGCLAPVTPQTLTEDPVRLLRGLRYLVRFDWQTTDAWTDALDKARQPAFWRTVAIGRLWREFQLIADEARAPEVFAKLAELGLDRGLFGESLQTSSLSALAARRHHGAERPATGRNWLRDLLTLAAVQPDCVTWLLDRWSTPASEVQRFRKALAKRS